MNRLEVEGVTSDPDEQVEVRPVSCLERVREILRLRPDVFVAGGEPAVKCNPNNGLHYTTREDFIVAPRVAIFDVDQLETFRQTLLLPGVRPQLNEAVRNWWYGENDPRNQMQVGYMAYDDFLGIRRRGYIDTVEEKEPGIATRLGLSVIQRNIVEQRLHRRTIVKVYPHPLLATIVYDFMSNPSSFDKDLRYLEYWVSQNQMAKFRELVEPKHHSISQIAHDLARAA